MGMHGDGHVGEIEGGGPTSTMLPYLRTGV